MYQSGFTFSQDSTQFVSFLGSNVTYFVLYSDEALIVFRPYDHSENVAVRSSHCLCIGCAGVYHSLVP